MIAGGGRGSILSALLAIAVFAVLRKEAGLRLPFPGTGANLGVMEMIDVELLARAVAWSAHPPARSHPDIKLSKGRCLCLPGPVARHRRGVGGAGRRATADVRAGLYRR